MCVVPLGMTAMLYCFDDGSPDESPVPFSDFFVQPVARINPTTKLTGKNSFFIVGAIKWFLVFLSCGGYTLDQNQVAILCSVPRHHHGKTLAGPLVKGKSL